MFVEEIEKNGIDDKTQDIIQELLKREGYDTDTLKMDVMDHQIGSNIINAAINNEKAAEVIVDFVEEQTRMFYIYIYLCHFNFG